MTNITIAAARLSQIRERSLRINIGWTLLGNLVYAGAQWALLVSLAKLGTTEDVGRFAFALAVSGPVFMFTNLQLRGIQATDARGEHRLPIYLGVRLASVAVSLVFIVTLSPLWASAASARLVILGVAMAKATEAMSDVLFGLFQQQERMELIAQSMMLKAGMSFVAFTGTLTIAHDLRIAVFALALSWLAVLVLFDVRNARRLVVMTPSLGISRLHPEFTIDQMQRLIRVALPLGVVMLFVSLNTNIPRYLIEHHFGTRQLGLFAAVTYVVIAGSTIVTALGQACAPRLSRYFAARDYGRFVALLAQLAGIVVAGASLALLVSVTAGRLVLTALYRPEYAAESHVLAWTVVAGGLGYVGSVLGYGLTAARAFDVQAPLFTVVSGVTAVASFAFVPRFGLMGGAWAMIAGALVQVLLSLWLLRRVLGDR